MRRPPKETPCWSRSPCTPRPPTRHPRRIRWNAQCPQREYAAHYDLELLGSEGSHGPRRESPLGPRRTLRRCGAGQGRSEPSPTAPIKRHFERSDQYQPQRPQRPPLRPGWQHQDSERDPPIDGRPRASDQMRIHGAHRRAADLLIHGMVNRPVHRPFKSGGWLRLRDYFLTRSASPSAHARATAGLAFS